MQLGPRQAFGNVCLDPDRMDFDVNGKLHAAVAGRGDVTELDRDGGGVERIATPGCIPANVCFDHGGVYT